MTKPDISDLDFEIEFQLFVLFHDIPFFNVKGVPMKITDRHLSAITRAIFFVNSGITGSMEPKHREQIEADLKLLEQLKQYCLRQISEPSMPLFPLADEILEIGESVGSKTPMPPD